MAKARSSAKQSRAQAQAQQQNGGGGHALSSKLARYLDPEASWDKDQLLDAVHWIRQVVGLICGLLWGAIPLVGAVWIALFMAISTGIIYWYYAYALKVDEEEYGGHGALLQEGLFASFTLFLVTILLHQKKKKTNLNFVIDIKFPFFFVACSFRGL
ncbi:unnamed protein product [Urochloa decumbens]|uniref:Rab5-interacting protein n=1 Tax=Urochloa decumbens TaxID=240449 RepID=A0ABC8W622_9POAL